MKRAKIIILDESTANLDWESDFTIQKTIRESFTHSTIITIAHRLDTVIESDKILVLDKGNAVEYDHPHLLLQNPSSMFSKLVKDSGTEQTLRFAAKQKYEQK